MKDIIIKIINEQKKTKKSVESWKPNEVKIMQLLYKKGYTPDNKADIFSYLKEKLGYSYDQIIDILYFFLNNYNEERNVDTSIPPDRTKSTDSLSNEQLALGKYLEIDPMFLQKQNYTHYGLDLYEVPDLGDSVEHSSTEWAIGTDSEAEDAAIRNVKDQLEDMPESFNQGWLENFIEISYTDKHLIAAEDADALVDDMDDDELIERADLENEYEELKEEQEGLENELSELNDLVNEMPEDGDEVDGINSKISELEDRIEEIEKKIEALVDGAREIVRDEQYEYVKNSLDDPIEYFVNETGMYSKEDLLKQSFIMIDYDKAAEAAVNDDGRGHFISSYDGVENEQEYGDEKYFIYRIN